jgi:geranylgeranyl pyrophosphate synthase
MRRILKKPRDVKSDSDVEFVRALMETYSSFEDARKVAREFAEEARKILLNECDWMTEKRWKRFFLDQTNYLIYRKK